MRSVEALSIAVRYFSRFPKAAVCFAWCSADEARHAAILAKRAIQLNGEIASVGDRSDVLNCMPGFKTNQTGRLQDLILFALRLSADKQRVVRRYKEIGDLLDDQPDTQAMFWRFAKDERAHIERLQELLDGLAEDDRQQSSSAEIPIGANLEDEP